MKEKNAVKEKSYSFALRIVKLYSYLRSNKREYHLSVQILKSGTSIGANIEEAIGGYSRKDFKSKLSIAYREARETNYWIRLLRDSSVIEEKLAHSLINDVNEILKLLTAILKTLDIPLRMQPPVIINY